LWLVFTLTSQAFVLGLLALVMTWNKIDITPAVMVLASVTTVLLSGIAAVAAGGLGYNASDTLRASGESKGAWTVSSEDPPQE